MKKKRSEIFFFESWEWAPSGLEFRWPGGRGGRIWGGGGTPVAFFEINLFKKKKKCHLQMAPRPALRTIRAGHTTTPPTEI